MQLNNNEQPASETFQSFPQFQQVFSKHSPIHCHNTYLMYLDLKYSKQQPLQPHHQLRVLDVPGMDRYCIHGLLRLPVGKEEQDQQETDENDDEQNESRANKKNKKEITNKEVRDKQQGENPLDQVQWKQVQALFVPVGTQEQMSFGFCERICTVLSEFLARHPTNQWITPRPSPTTTTNTEITQTELGETINDDTSTIYLSFGFVDSDSSITYYRIQALTMDAHSSTATSAQ